VVLCGHSHQQHLIELSHGPLTLNPGSVGCPSYDDPGTDPHVSEAGSPHARYAVLTIGEQVPAELIAVAYDWRAAAARAEANGRSEWAYGLRTGWFLAAQSRTEVGETGDRRLPPFPACLAQALHDMVADSLSHQRDTLFHIQVEHVRCSCDSLIQRGPSFVTPTLTGPMLLQAIHEQWESPDDPQSGVWLRPQSSYSRTQCSS
jgi:hypothetical protein